MSKKFQNKYRIASARLPNYDYSQNGYYFITICTKNRAHFFGEIVDHKMQLSEIGQIAQKYWLEIPNHFPFSILDEFIIIPNHIHGIIKIHKNTTATSGTSVGVETPKLGVSTGRNTNGNDTDKNINEKNNNKTIPWGNGCLGIIINQYQTHLHNSN